MACHGCQGEADGSLRICRHVAGGPLVTVAGPPGETICTECEAGSGARPLVAVCPRCHAFYVRHTIRPTSGDRSRGYALVERRMFGVLHDRPWPHAPLARVGDVAKLSFSIVPSRQPTYVESMWVRVVAREDDRMVGLLDNEPGVFPLDILKVEDRVEFESRNVVDARAIRLLERRGDDHRCGYCDPAPRERDLDETDRRTLADIRTYGWQLVSIEDVEPGYVFSVGLFHTFGHPEILAFGLPQPILGEVLNRIGALVRDGRRFDPGVESSDLLEGATCRFVPIRREAYPTFLGMSVLVLPGAVPGPPARLARRTRRWPWDEGYPAALARLQPRLDP